MRKINPSGLFAERLLITCDILRPNIVLGRVVFVGPDTVPVKSVIEFSGRRWRDRLAGMRASDGKNKRQKRNGQSVFHVTENNVTVRDRRYRKIGKDGPPSGP